MKEYKLSRKSKYSLFYLLCGLFMFFFMFAILNLSSYAKGTSINLKTASPRPTSFEGSCTVSFGTPSFTVNIPADSGLAQATSKTFYYSTNLYVTTTAGTFLLRTDTYNFNATVYPSQINTFTSNLHMTGIGSYQLAGQFISADLVLDSDDPIDYFTFNGTEYGTVTQGSYSSTYRGDVYGGMRSELKGFGISSVNSNFVSYSSSNSGSSSSSFMFSDYSSYSLVNSDTSLEFSSYYNSVSVPAGNVVSYTVDDINTTNANFLGNGFIHFDTIGSNKFVIRFAVRASTTDIANLGNGFYLVFNFDGTNYLVYPSDMDKSGYLVYPNGDRGFVFNATYEFPSTETSVHCIVGLLGTYSVPIKSFSFACYKYKATISDYMEYVKENYESINPTVSDLNQNTAQSVSDINTAQTFETSAFDNFNTQFSSSGLDTFSMSFASTPLLWVSSIITTFYNNMPSTFQYLLMFVAFVGILCTVLNVFGRVAQRFGGGDSSAKLNSKDVFSKIEKNGSI